MQILLTIILPVFLVIGFGYLARMMTWIDDTGVDGVMRFAHSFAIPCLLFSAISKIDLGADFSPRLLLSFYTGASISFALGLFGARVLFKRDWESAVAIGFVALFSNSLLLGVAITERAYGPEALAGNFTIIALHSPFCYGLGITVMEIARAGGLGQRGVGAKVLRAIFKNTLIIGIMLGFIVNISGVPLPQGITAATDLMARAALPVALFGMGGVLFRYRPAGDMATILYVVALSLVVHPLITFGMGRALGLGVDGFRSAVLTAAMSPGINGYVFAHMYGVGKRVAASAVLIGTGLAVVTVWIWIGALS